MVMGKVIVTATVTAKKVIFFLYQKEKRCFKFESPRTGHFCGNNNCKKLVTNLPSESSTMDCCELNVGITTTAASETIVDTSVGPDTDITTSIRPFEPEIEDCWGGDDCCTPENQCRERMGDCDNDNDCLGNLVCKVRVNMVMMITS